jgi:hypothetical protein
MQVGWSMAATQSSTEVKPKGIKRPPTDDLENDQRLAKRFNLLNLGMFRGAKWFRLTARASG